MEIYILKNMFAVCKIPNFSRIDLNREAACITTRLLLAARKMDIPVLNFLASSLCHSLIIVPFTFLSSLFLLSFAFLLLPSLLFFLIICKPLLNPRTKYPRILLYKKMWQVGIRAKTTTS